MGTFHDNLGDFHGYTVVVHQQDGTISIGRCHESSPQRVVLLDVDQSTDLANDADLEQWLAKAAQYGVFGKHKQLTLPGENVKSIQLLNQFTSTPVAG